MTGIRITPDMVREMATFAERISNGNIRMQYTSNPGDGIRYVDGKRQLVWCGKYASSKAFAYYYGASGEYVTDETRAEYDAFTVTYSAINNRAGVARWSIAGKDDAISRKGIQFPNSR